MKILGTERLVLRSIETNDAPFYLRLVNEPSWLQFIGEKGVRTLADARTAIRTGPMAMQERLGFSLYLCELKGSAVAIGLCGLIKRDSLPEVDIGFAFLPEFWGEGYAFEAANAVIDHGVRRLGLKRLMAITSPDNTNSIRLIERLGLCFDRIVELPAQGGESRLFVRDFDNP